MVFVDLSRAAKAIREKRPLCRNGRPPYLREETLDELDKQLEMRILSGDAPTHKEFKTMLLEAKQREAARCGYAIAHVCLPVPRTVRLYRKKLGLDVLYNFKTHTSRRNKASFYFVIFLRSRWLTRRLASI